MPDTTYTLKQISEHNSTEDCWMAIDDQVYDLSSYLSDHLRFLDIEDWCGRDASSDYHSKAGRNRDHSSRADDLLGDYLIGVLINDQTAANHQTSQPIAVGDENQAIFKTAVYNVWLPVVATTVFYLITNKFLSKARHNFIWNSVLLLGLFPSFVVGLLMAMNLISKKWLYSHVELSIIFGMACVMHLIYRIRSYFAQGKRSFRK